VNEQLVPAFDQVPGHGRAHDAEADKTDVAHENS
jgi:hypothetical protein